VSAIIFLFPVCESEMDTGCFSVLLMSSSSGAVHRLKTRRPPVSLAVLSARVLYLGEESVCPAPPSAWASTIVCDSQRGLATYHASVRLVHTTKLPVGGWFSTPCSLRFSQMYQRRRFLLDTILRASKGQRV